MSSEEEIESIKNKLKSVANSIREFMLQLGKLRQDLLDLSTDLEKLPTIQPAKEKTILTELPPTPTPEPPQPQEIPPSPETTEPTPTETQTPEQKIPEPTAPTPAESTTPTPTTPETPPTPTAQTPAENTETTTTPTPEPATITTQAEQVTSETKQLESLSELGTSAIPLNEVVKILNELEQFCEGSLPAGEVADKIEATKKALQPLVLYHPVYYEMDQIATKLRSTSPDQPLSPTDKVMLLSKIPEWKRRMM